MSVHHSTPPPPSSPQLWGQILVAQIYDFLAKNMSWLDIHTLIILCKRSCTNMLNKFWSLSLWRGNSNFNHSCRCHTDKKENKIFLIYKEIQSGAVAKSYMRKGFLIYEEIRKYFPIYGEAVSHIWLCDCSNLNFPIYEEN